MFLNTAHRFYEQVYDGDATSPETRTAIEILLFTLGDVMLEGPEDSQVRSRKQLSAWSQRLELALANLADHLRAGDDEDADVAFSSDDAA